MVDQDENISLGGKSGVRIYIDGRPSPLEGKDLSGYLATIPASAIESIEIITSPSANFDAGGSAGIVNIKLKKLKLSGTNGSMNVSYAQGVFAKYTGGFALNHRNDKINIYGNYNYTNGLNLFVPDIYRFLADSNFASPSQRFTYRKAHRINAGMDYFINRNSTIGFMIDGNYTNDSIGLNGSTTIYPLPAGKPDRILISNNESLSRAKNLALNINYHYEDTSGRKLDMDINYGVYQFRTNFYQPNTFYDPQVQHVLLSRIYTMTMPSDISISNYKIDYEQNLWKGRFSAGVKIAFVHTGNKFQLFNHDNNNNQLKLFDSSLFNHFIYKEHINAGYASYSRSFKRIQLLFGLRVEQTISNGKSSGYVSMPAGFTAVDSVFRRELLDFFPSGSISFKPRKKEQ